jgi:hypothetical protein
MIPLWIKVAYTAITLLVVVVYWRRHGPRNFLWFSDVSLIGLVFALWLESTYLVSMLAIGMLLPEILWNVSFFVQLLTGRRFTGLTDYMFDPRRLLWLRLFSLFHVLLPVVMVYALLQLGYDGTALPAMVVLGLVVLLASYPLADAQENLNWVLGPGIVQTWMAGWKFLLLVMITYPLLLYLPTHLLLQWLFRH